MDTSLQEDKSAAITMGRQRKEETFNHLYDSEVKTCQDLKMDHYDFQIIEQYL